MLMFLLADALLGWEEGPGQRGWGPPCLGGKPGYTWLLIGGSQLDAGSHHLHPGAILFQHLLGQG